MSGALLRSVAGVGIDAENAAECPVPCTGRKGRDTAEPAVWSESAISAGAYTGG
jgi:hypothetical protein